MRYGLMKLYMRHTSSISSRPSCVDGLGNMEVLVNGTSGAATDLEAEVDAEAKADMEAEAEAVLLYVRSAPVNASNIVSRQPKRWIAITLRRQRPRTVQCFYTRECIPSTPDNRISISSTSTPTSIIVRIHHILCLQPAAFSIILDVLFGLSPYPFECPPHLHFRGQMTSPLPDSVKSCSFAQDWHAQCCFLGRSRLTSAVLLV
jgi:hypothetical protein